MSGKIQLKLQWSKAKHPKFKSYPYWSIEVQSGESFKKQGYGISRATLSREAWKKILISYVEYERFLDVVMNRRPDFDKWCKDLIESLRVISLKSFDEVKIKNVRELMSEYWPYGQNLELLPFTTLIDDDIKSESMKK